MTWLGDPQNKIVGQEREKLILKRAELVKDIEQLKKSPILSRTQSAIKFRQEDLVALATEIIKIDVKLGRITK